MKKLNKVSSETVIDIPTIERDLRLNTIPIIWLLLRQYNCMAGILFIRKSQKPQPPKRPKINPWILKVLSVIVITLISWLDPEAAIALFLIRLLLIWLEYLNQK